MLPPKIRTEAEYDISKRVWAVIYIYDFVDKNNEIRSIAAAFHCIDIEDPEIMLGFQIDALEMFHKKLNEINQKD